jgi:hypothetical protein
MRYPVLNAKPAINEAHHRVSAVGFKHYVTEMVRWATSGRQYTGLARSESYKQSQDRRGEWGRLLQRFNDIMANSMCPIKAIKSRTLSAASQRDLAGLNCRQT